MEDAQRQPRDSDRSPVRDRIKRAVAEGRISAPDGEIRLTNVSSAHSMAELGLIVRDLDQLDAAISPGTPPPPPATAPNPYLPNPAAAHQTGGGGGRRIVWVLVAVFVVVLGAGGVLAFASFGGTSSSSTDGEQQTSLPSALPITPRASPGAVGSVGADPSPVDPGAPAGPTYVLSADGIKDFLATYRSRFSTSKVVDATFYDDYVIVQVPVPGKARHSGWLYRDGEFKDFGGVTANFPGAGLVDTRRLDLKALMRNVAKARKSLNVEDYNQTYVTLTYRPQFDQVPSANIYVANEFHESGYLATGLDGTVERSYPFAG